MKRVREENINTAARWDENYATPESATRWTQWGATDLVQAVANAIPRGAHVLDVATGAGLGPLAIHAIRPDIIWHATDYSIKAIDYLLYHSKVPWRALVHNDITKGLPFSENTFDVVMCTELLEHLEDPAAAVAELFRVARYRVILTVPRNNVVDTEYHVWAIGADDLPRMFPPEALGVTMQLARSNRQIVAVGIKKLWDR